VRLLRFDPDILRKPSPLLPESDLLEFFDERGYGLAGILDAVLNRGDDSFQKLKKQVRVLFPVIEHLRLKVVSPQLKEIYVELNSGQQVSAEFLSEGLLFYLAFAAVPYLSPVSVILVEEPENGLHPARIKDVVNVLRELSKSVQVIIATHSPLVINELEPEEVTVVTRHEKDGTIATPLKDTPNFKTRSKVFALGELWLNYANGMDEGPLLNSEQE
jgi:predicted ATPase